MLHLSNVKSELRHLSPSKGGWTVPKAQMVTTNTTETCLRIAKAHLTIISFEDKEVFARMDKMWEVAMERLDTNKEYINLERHLNSVLEKLHIVSGIKLSKVPNNWHQIPNDKLARLRNRFGKPETYNLSLRE